MKRILKKGRRLPEDSREFLDGVRNMNRLNMEFRKFHDPNADKLRAIAKKLDNNEPLSAEEETLEVEYNALIQHLVNKYLRK